MKRPLATYVLAGMIPVIGYLDSRSGFALSLFPLYLVCVVTVAWHNSRGVTATVASLAAAVIIFKDSVAPVTRGPGFYWDEGIKVFLLLLVSYGVWKMKSLLAEKEQANLELKQALSELKELRQMIPICAWCHSIRNDRGFYERIEVYLSKITGAGFTHGICPDCMKKHYGHLLAKEQEEKREGDK